MKIGTFDENQSEELFGQCSYLLEESRFLSYCLYNYVLL